MLALGLGSSPAGLTHCRVHQRAWVASLDRWVAFHVPTRDGSPGTDAPCDRCAAGPQGRRGSEGTSGGAGHARGTTTARSRGAPQPRGCTIHGDPGRGRARVCTGDQGIVGSDPAMGRTCGHASANTRRRRRPRPGDTWHLDEGCITINTARH